MFLCQMQYHNRPFRLSLLLLLVLTGCSTPPPTPPEASSEPEVVPHIEISAADLLRRAESSSGADAANLRLQAAELLYEQGESDAAETTLTAIDTKDLEPALRADILLLRAEIAREQEQARSALNLLQPGTFPALASLDASYQIRYHRLRAQAYYDMDAMLSSALERIQLDRLLSEQAQENNHALIWEALGTLPMSQLESLAGTAINYEIRGWYQLALIPRLFSNDLDKQLIEIGRWKQNWSRHPAAAVLPPEMDQVETMARERPRRIALLLPLESPAGIIVRDAFMSAYFNLLEMGGQVPEITLYDTPSTADILGLHQRAVQEGAELVIGPLLKEQVAVLQATADLQVPTLALNNVEGGAPASPMLYQFALSPEDEARQIANKAWRDGHRRVAILHPRDDTRKSASFVTEWLSLGGEVVSQEEYSENYTDTITRMLELDRSSQRHSDLNKLLGRTTISQPRRRQDIDFIYLVAQPAPARQIVPSLAYLYAGNIPIYASQDVYSGIPRPVEDRDLNGVTFGESPWLLDQDDTSVGRTRELFPQSSSQTLRLQAFGIDAFRLYPRLKLLSSNTSTVIPGASGMLRLGSNQNIVRQLTWASIKEGLVASSE